MDPDLLEKFTSHLKNVLVRAYTLAHELGENSIKIEHILWSLLTEKGSIGSEILVKANLSPKNVRMRLTEKVGKSQSSSASAKNVEVPKLAEETKRAIEKAVHTAHLYEHKYVGTEHLLSGILANADGELKKIFSKEKTNLRTLKQQLNIVLKSTSKFPELTDGLSTEEISTNQSQKSKRLSLQTGKKTAKTPALDFFAVDLTGDEAQERIDPVIGREHEIDRLTEILSRRTKNNPLLLGEPGVGKTAIVEGLAKRIAEGRIPETLRKKRILALDLPLVVAGTMYRGEFEGRLKQIIDELKVNKEIILFLDEIHTITGAGSASGSLDAANILKPYLARGEVRCIGATTLSEYKKHIEGDAALDRRFQSIQVTEPNSAETMKILEGVKAHYEKFHMVKIPNSTCEVAVAFAERYLPDSYFPDKALDLIDESAAAVKIRQTEQPQLKKISELEHTLEEIQKRKQEAVSEEHYVQALKLKEREISITSEISQIKTTQERHKHLPTGTVLESDVARTISRMTGIPLTKITIDDSSRLLDLENELQEHIVGQDHVLKGVSDAVRRARSGLAHPGRPLASFLFMGPSGVGKTELAKAIAHTVFQDKKALIRLDMSEFGESFTVSKLIGAPAGYVGYRDNTKLTDLVKRRPYAVVLFDEVEKAHPDVLNLLLQILEDGQITDSTGKRISFTQTVIILTSNIGLERYLRGPMGFDDATSGWIDEEDMRKEALNNFRPELINRIDKIFVFKPLGTEELELIVRREVDQLSKRLADQRVTLTVTDKAVLELAKMAHSPEKGARAVRALVHEYIESPASTYLLRRRGKRRLSLILKQQGNLLRLSTYTKIA